MNVDVFKIPQNAPDDLSGLKHLIEQKTLDPKTIVAIMGKTESNARSLPPLAQTKSSAQ